MNTLSLSDRLENAPAMVLDGVTIRATPYRWRDPTSIPVRPWVYGRWFLRGTVACLIAPGGVGKSTLIAGTALAMASGDPLLGKTVWDGPKRVWLWNLEDDLDELSRSIQAAAIHHDIAASVLNDKLFVDSGMEGMALCTATETNGQFKLLVPVYEALSAELVRRGIDVLIVDPFVSSHEVEENANSKIDKIAKAWGRVAKAANCVIILVHHTSKAGSSEVTAMSARGAVALINAARTALVINRMDEKQAERLGIPDNERRRYIMVQDDKHNRAPAEKADWYRLASVDLGNGGGGNILPGDNMAVVEPWSLPDPFENVTSRHIAEVQARVAVGAWRQSPQAKDWVGHVVADVLGLNASDKADKARICALMKAWIENDKLRIEQMPDSKREMRPFVVVGEPVKL
ncbi:hypothetical protein Sbs19_36020 [Sphingobium sp. BS19]|nr:hypothetical protein Sbs19_36020 [Sphingobium sp. BS19]